jgi:hypothetical protein
MVQGMLVQDRFSAGMHERDAEWALWDDHNLAALADKWSWTS